MKILIIDDDTELNSTLKDSLITLAHTVDIAENGGEGSFLGKSYEYDIIIIDYSLPKKNGIEVCKEIRAAQKTTPIIFLSASEAIDIKVLALNNGADDYMTKPFSLKELIARISALYRRPTITRPTILRVGDLTVDLNTRIVTLADEEIRLTKKEFGVLEYLMQHKGTIVSRTLIMEYVWTADIDIFSNAVESHIRNLRKKLQKADSPEIIVNIPGRGYMIPTYT